MHCWPFISAPNQNVIIINLPISSMGSTQCFWSYCCVKSLLTEPYINMGLAGIYGTVGSDKSQPHLNSLPLKIPMKSWISNFQSKFSDWWLRYLGWMLSNLTDYKSTLVQVMAWCLQATRHYLNECWPRSMWPYGISRPQWVNHSIEITSRSYVVSRV